MNTKKFLVTLLVLVVLVSGATACAPAPETDASAAATMAAAQATEAAALATKAAAAQAIAQTTQMAQSPATAMPVETPSPVATPAPSEPSTATPSTPSPGSWTVRGTDLFGEQHEQQLPAGQGPYGPVPVPPGMEALPLVAPMLAGAGSTTSTPTATNTPTPVVLDTSAAMEIRYGDVITEEIKPSGDMDIYAFAGKAGDVAHIAAAGTEDAPWLSLKIQVFDSQGQPVGTESSGDGEYNLVADGQYTFTVRESGTRTGPYNVVLKNVALGAGTRIDYGDVVEGEISLAGEKDVYTFEGKAGDVARIALSEEEHGQAQLVVKLLDPQGESLGSDDIWVGNTALIERTLTTDGHYTVEIWITGHLDTPRTGGYTLLLKNTATGAATRLAYGDIVEAEIRPLGDKDVYTFEWKAGDEIVIEATQARLGSGLELYVEVFDAQGNSLAVGSTGRIKPSLSDEGTYTIVVRDKGWHSSFSTGSYTLSLKNLAVP